MIAMGAAVRNVFIRAHFSPPIEIMFLEVRKTVVLSIIVFETAVGIRDFRFEIPIVYFLNLLIKLLVRCPVIRFCQQHCKGSARLKQPKRF